MGKPSRRKHAQWRERSRRGGTFEGSGIVGPPRKLFRYFNDIEHAKALCQGKVFLSTLERCRRYELLGQGDKGEAEHVYVINRVGERTHGADAVRLASSRIGIEFVGQVDGVELSGIDALQRLPDGYVLCFTEEFGGEGLASTFGTYCVEIVDSVLFCNAVHRALIGLVPIAAARMGRIAYRDRRFIDVEPDFPIGFVKPALPFEGQKEVRMLWLPENVENLRARVLDIPSVARLCRPRFEST